MAPNVILECDHGQPVQNRRALSFLVYAYCDILYIIMKNARNVARCSL